MIEENYKFQYENWHQDTKESREQDIKTSSDFIKLHGILPVNKNATIIDVGCGMGRFLLAYKEAGYNNLSGIDLDDYQIKIAKKEGLSVELKEAHEYFIKCVKKYDLITMIDCLEHLNKDIQIELLKNIYKILSEDGSLVIRVPNALSPVSAYMRYIDFTHKTSYTDTSLGYVLKNAGFKHIVFRPAWEENEQIIQLKSQHAKLLYEEFGIKEPILTSNIVAVAFKNSQSLNSYIKLAPKIEIKYNSTENVKNIKRKKWLRKIKIR